MEYRHLSGIRCSRAMGAISTHRRPALTPRVTVSI